MSGFDARLWRLLHRTWLILILGVLGLLLGLGASPQRGESLFGLLLVLLAGLPVGNMLWRMPSKGRATLRQLPRYRPMMGLTAGLLACGIALVLCWTIANTLSPGTLTPLSLALVTVAIAGVAAFLGSRLRHR